MEEVVGRANLVGALKRVRQNKGSPGIDGMSVEELPEYLRRHWGEIRQRLWRGPTNRSLRRQEIREEWGRGRELGIPTVLDRFIQQAILQVLQPRFDPTFSRHSHGFRPGRRAHDAVREAQQYIQEGRRWVVDVDLEKFFDRVNHDVLMGRWQTSKALRILRSLPGSRSHGERGGDGAAHGDASGRTVVAVAGERAPGRSRQGGSYDAFVRYADDCNVYVRSRRAGQRCDAGAEALVRETSASGLRGKERGGASVGSTVPGLQLLGTRPKVVKRRVSQKALKFKERVRQITSRSGGRLGCGRATALRAGVEGILSA